MARMQRAGIAALAAAALTVAAGGTAGAAQAPPGGTFTGTLNGAAYVVDVPAGWNGTVLLWNHAYEPPVTTPQDADADNPEVKTWLLAHGYALAGIHYPDVAFPTPGAVGDDLALLSWFRSHVGRPGTTLTWGMSLGGELTATLAERAAPAFDGALPMCGETAGPGPDFNALLDAAYTLNTLVWPQKPVQIAHIASPASNQAAALAQLSTAWQSADPRTQARLALAASLADIPGWADSLAPEPTALGDRIDAAVAYLYYEVPEFLWGSGRSDTEALLGGNPSWNIGVDYRAQFAGSASRDLVDQAYAKAGGSEALDADLAALNSGQRVAPDPGAAAKLAVQGSITGLVGIPVLTLHDTGDGIAPVGNERSYADAVARAGRSPLLRQEFVARANHCFFTGSEEITALQTLTARVKTGRWPDTSAAVLNASAGTFGLDFQQMWSYFSPGPAAVAPAFVDTRPAPFVRGLR
ncbi:conserved hypothetical protein [Catenulispora acidiphila DSM 44928]|uniref:Uncharacterized protein n=1 Tax=Catenulispora acidiphila (strain DSM 44928 / JCM 14897 / NBRC 102108 / NRRL B-24433 / ID139908) TaxID=479433 RepID=C7QFW7_CATAD|nr:hypothetical protein [Catenulispora acidiphila]ACU70944.1 conserved hypothetical protein [Catenulispora acidiphila DSM 44928]